MSQRKEISLSGMRTTGALHIGHYLGAMKNFIKFDAEYDSFLMLSDLQALNDNFVNKGKMKDSVTEILADLYALDLKNTTIFIESEIGQIPELTMYFSNLVTVNRLLRNPTIKSEMSSKKELFGENGESVNLGLISSPVSQTADICIVKATRVPVGEDQLPFLEVGRDIVSKFNTLYGEGGEVLPIFEPVLTPTPRILGLDGSTKMSKSLNNSISLKDTSEITLEKIKKAKTDSESHISFEPKNRPSVSNLVLIYSAFSDTDVETVVNEFKLSNFSTFKNALAELINRKLKHFRERRNYAINNISILNEIKKNGHNKVNVIAQNTLLEVKNAMGINY
jgi:tryptophanyl-tRNA synthetase